MNSTISIDYSFGDKLSEIVKNIKADYAEIRAEEKVATNIVFKGKDPELISKPYSLGFFVRVLINGSWGITSFSDTSSLKEKILEAVEFATFAGKGKVELAPVKKTNAQILSSMKKDFRQISLEDKVLLIKRYNELLLKSAKNIQTTNISYADNFLKKLFINSTGSKIFQERPYVRVSCQAIARKNEVIEMYRDSFGHVGGFEVVEGLDESMAQVSRQASEVVGYPKVKSGVYTAILDPFMTGTFAHEAFGHFSEADHQYENPKILSQMQLGKKIGSDKVTIIDDPVIEGGWGNFAYDDEGVKATRVNLLTNGVVTGRLHSLETASKLNELPNGRARADGFYNKPIPRMSNTFFDKGKDHLEDLIESTQKGLLVVNWLAGMTALENFTFSAMYGVMIEDGKLSQKVRGVKLMGNVFETLKNIDGVTGDFNLDQGTCGKEGQHMPVGAGGGYIRVNNITVGGQ